MPKKKRESNEQSSVRVGNISDVSGSVNVAGRDITTLPANKEDLKAEVKEIQDMVIEAVQKNAKVDEGFLSRRFRNIARMSPDILDVVVATLANPLAGLGIAVKKIADKAKQETRAP
jgi:hypothetical protein